MKKNMVVIIFLMIISGVLVYSFVKTGSLDNISYIRDVEKIEKVLDKELNVKYISGDMIDEELSFGNTYTKEIEIKNANDSDVSFSIDLLESEISNGDLSYSVYLSDETDELILKDKKISNNIIAYNLTVNKFSVLKVKLEFKANKENEVTSFKGRLRILTNLTEKELFIEQVKNAHEELESRINKLNGISVPGFYYIDASSLNNNIGGNVIIDATDISSLIYYYSVNTSKYSIDDYNYQGELTKNNIKNDNIISSLDDACRTHSKKGCSDFSSIPYNESGGKKAFFNNSISVISNVKTNIKVTNKSVYIVDVKSDISNETNISGYILIDNTKDSPEYFIYLTDNTFMISGYNYSKYGEYRENGTTIRAYKESAFNLSASDKGRVCSFSGFSECFSINGEKV